LDLELARLFRGFLRVECRLRAELLSDQRAGGGMVSWIPVYTWGGVLDE
jgi:hypothetical protein